MTKLPSRAIRATAAIFILIYAFASVTIGIAGMSSAWAGEIEVREQYPNEFIRRIHLDL